MINDKKLNMKFITDKNGKKKEVILPINEFNSILEDIADLAIVAERRNEKTVKHDDVVKSLKENGLL